MAGLMELLPINEKKSRAAAEEIFEAYREQRGFLNEDVNPRITSAWGDGQPTGSVSPHPYAQQLMERQQRAEAFCEWCERCVRKLPRQSHRDLINARYIDGTLSEHPDTTAMDMLDISSATYFRRKADALLAAAFYLGVEMS